MKQIDKIRQLYDELDGDEIRVIAAYAVAELKGEVKRVSDEHDLSPHEYAKRLYYNTYKRYRAKKIA